MNPKRTCTQCVHYRRHYVFICGHYGEAMCGHCTYPRLKHRTPDTPACAHFFPLVPCVNADADPKTEIPNA